MNNSTEQPTKGLMENNPFGITREDVLNLAAQKLVDAYSGDPDLSDEATSMIRKKVDELFATKLTQRVDEFLASEMEKLIGQELIPVNIWGDREGKPTTIRAELARRAKDYWEVKVNGEGKEVTYGGKTRSEWMVQRVVNDEFAKAVKANAQVIIGEFKTAIKADAAAMIAKHIDALINVESR